jgi:hyaluronan synthase
MKAAESILDAVTCCSGPLSAYRRDVVLEVLEPWLKQSFLGCRATFGDDRSLTNFVLRTHHTKYQDSAVVRTICPNTYKIFFKQQLRWKRSWFRETIIAATFMWKKEPLAFLFFMMGLIVPILAPIIVIYNCICVPVMFRTWPIAFLLGLFLMSGLFATMQLFFRKSTTWIFGIGFVVLYCSILIWQLPFGMLTFYKSNWSTRMTNEDLIEAQKEEAKAKKK